MMFVCVSVQMAPMNVEVRGQPWVSVVTSILRPVLLFTCASYARLVVPEVPPLTVAELGLQMCTLDLVLWRY